MTRFFALDSVSEVDGRVGPPEDDRVQMHDSVPDLVIDWGSSQTDTYVPFMRDSDPLVAWSHSYKVLSGGVLEVSVTRFSRPTAVDAFWSRGDDELVRLYSPSYWTRVSGRRGKAATPVAPPSQSTPPTTDPNRRELAGSNFPSRPDGSRGIPRHPGAFPSPDAD
jgi:hypothetical protein